MKLPKTWLDEYVELDVSPRQFAADMTMSGSKVEEYYNDGDKIKNVVIGRVDSIEEHPDSDHLVVCQIDVAGERKLQIVTGASNLKVGDIVPVCLDGAHLPDGKVIKKGKLRGVLSEGMLCSLSELGLTLGDFPYAIEDGIFVIEEPCNLGDDATKVLGIDNVVTDFEITSNRTDCYSIIGLAREAAATYDKKANIKTPVVKGCGGNAADHISVSVEAPDLCPRYIARVVKNVKIGPSPRWMRERLRLCGVRPISNIVDITNYVMLEYGQPLHAFDARFLPDRKILVRRANEGEKITTLDGTDRVLDPSILVITDGKQPVAVAGVMGGLDSEIKEDTTEVIFESANFNGPCVRKGARKLGMRTDASNLYEKGLPAYQTKLAIDRVCELVELLGCGEVVDGCVDVDNSTEKKTDLKLDVERTNKFLATSLSRDEMVAILRRLEFDVLDDDTIIVPAYRQDIECFADVAEEIVRIYGYNKVEPSLFKGSATTTVTAKYHDFKQKVSDALASLGFFEIKTYTFISPKLYDKALLADDSSMRNSVTILNPLGEDSSIMRTLTMPSMLSILSKNYNNRNTDVALFEIGKTFTPTGDANTLPDEKSVITLGAYGSLDFYDMKGYVCALLDNLKIKDVSFESGTDLPYYHPGRCATLKVGDTVIGRMGQIHPVCADNFDIGSDVYAAELSLETLYDLVDTDITYIPLPKFPAVTRDLALLCDDELEAAKIENVIKAESKKLFEDCKLFDIYKGSQIPEGKKSIAFTITLRAADRTLVDEEVDTVMKRIVKKLVADLGCEQR